MILHLDGDAFFVAVEVAKNPQLRGLPVVTGEERGIVTALSYEAKALGVTRGLPVFRLKRDFPQVIVLSGDYPSYVRYSGLMIDIVRRYVDDVEEYSIDECFADLTGLDQTYIGGIRMSYYEIAAKIKKEIEDELDLSVSLGVASTKCLAKVASKWVKPKGLTMIAPEMAIGFLAKVPIEKVWGIGRETSTYLRRHGVATARDFVEKGIVWVEEHLAKPYGVIWHELSGTSVMKVDSAPKRLYSSVQKTRTFRPPTNDKVFLLAQLSKHIEEACAKARHYGLIPREASIFLKTQDFRYASISLPLELPTNAPEILIALTRKMIDKIHFKGVLYRASGVRLHGLVPETLLSVDLFGHGKQAGKFEEIHKKIDELEGKYGKRLVHLGSTLGALSDDEDEEEVMERNLLFL